MSANYGRGEVAPMCEGGWAALGWALAISVVLLDVVVFIVMAWLHSKAESP